MHKQWERDLIGVVINDKFGYSSVEIDESKIISQGNEIFWIFGCIDRNIKQTRVRCVLTDRTKNKLLPIIKKYKNTNNDNMDIKDENCSIRTSIFSDCLRSYQPSVFNNMGFIHKRINQVFGLVWEIYMQIP